MASEDDTALKTEPPDGLTDEISPATSFDRKTVAKVALRIGVAVGAIAISTFALSSIFNDLDLGEIKDALGRLSDAEWLALVFGWVLWVGAQGLQTASLVHAMPARRGVLAYLGPSAVASVIPGPSDLPVRYSMYQSWGVPSNEAGTAVAASGVFSVGSQLALPALAGVLIFFGDIELKGFMNVVVGATLGLAVAIVGIVFILGSESRVRRVASWLEPLWARGHRLLRKGTPDRSLAEVVVDQRTLSLDHLQDKWLKTTAATVLTIAMKSSLLVMALRFVGIPESDLTWSAIFAVFALVAGLTVVPITPGSAGVAEFGYVGMLTPLAGDEFVNEVAAGVLLFRLLTWILLIPTGLACLGVWKFTTSR